MACLMGCKTDTDETPTYAKCKELLITDGGLKTDTNRFLNVDGAHLGPIGTRVMAMNEG